MQKKGAEKCKKAKPSNGARNRKRLKLSHLIEIGELSTRYLHASPGEYSEAELLTNLQKLNCMAGKNTVEKSDARIVRRIAKAAGIIAPKRKRAKAIARDAKKAKGSEEPPLANKSNGKGLETVKVQEEKKIPSPLEKKEIRDRDPLLVKFEEQFGPLHTGNGEAIDFFTKGFKALSKESHDDAKDLFYSAFEKDAKFGEAWWFYAVALSKLDYQKKHQLLAFNIALFVMASDEIKRWKFPSNKDGLKDLKLGPDTISMIAGQYFQMASKKDEVVPAIINCYFSCIE